MSAGLQQPEQPTPADRTDRARDLRVGAVTTLLVATLGGPVGLAWAAVRPRIDPGAAALQESVFARQLDSDLRLLLLGAVAGAVAGALAWSYTRSRRPGAGVAVGLAVGGILAMVLAAAVGPLAAHTNRLEGQVTEAFAARGFTDFRTVTEPDRSNFLNNVRFGNRARPVLLGMPVLACAALAGLTALGERGDRRRAPAVSSG